MRILLVCALGLAASACGAACPAPAAPSSAAELAPLVRALAAAPRRASPAGTATVALLAQGQNAFVGWLEMEPGASVPEHRDADEEYVVVLEGRGRMQIDGVEHEVGPGTVIFMPANATVSFQNGDARMVALQVFAGPGSAGKYDRWAPVALQTGDGDGP